MRYGGCIFDFMRTKCYICNRSKTHEMAKLRIIGREYEQAIIRNYLESDKAELIAVYGRRRVGKTYLVKSIFDNEFDFFYTGLYEVQRAIQLNQFKKTLERYSGQKIKRFKDWFEAFDALRDYLDTLSKEKIIVFLDEIPWMDTPKSNFLAAFGQFWNDWASTKQNLKLFVCGICDHVDAFEIYWGQRRYLRQGLQAC